MGGPSGEGNAADYLCRYVTEASIWPPERVAEELLSGRGPAATPLDGPYLDLPLECAVSMWEGSAGARGRDCLDDIVESRGDALQRRVAGRYYTAPLAVRLMVRLALYSLLVDRSSVIAKDLRRWVGGSALAPRVVETIASFVDGIRIVDPACGSGAFLLGALAELVRLGAGDPAGLISGNLFGVDSDPVAVAACRYALWAGLPGGTCPGAGFRTNVTCADSLFDEVGKAGEGGYDVVLLNPPYVRHELLTSEFKSRLKSKYPGFPLRSDLYVYFFSLVERLLKPGGVGAVICPTAWMSVGYGRDLERYLRERFQVRAIIRSGVERWFPGANVDAGIVLLSGTPTRARTAMLTLDKPLGHTRWDLLAEAACHVRSGRAPEGAEVQYQSFSARAVTAGGLASKRWGSLFEEDPVAVIMRTDGKRACRLGDIARIARGFTTGANGFFYVERIGETRPGYARIRPSGEPPRGREFEIPSGMLFPVVRSPREVRAYETALEHLKYCVFVAGENGESDALDEFLRWGVARGFHLRPTCSARPDWWRLRRPRPPGIVWPMTIRERFFAALNGEALIDARLYGVYAAAGVDPALLAAILNSSVTWLAAECSCRTYGGGGGPLDTKVYEVRNLLIPDPRLIDPGLARDLESSFKAIRKRPVLSVSSEVGLPDRAALDEAVLVSLGFNLRAAASAGERIRDMLERRVRSRTIRARNPLDS